MSDDLERDTEEREPAGRRAGAGNKSKRRRQRSGEGGPRKPERPVTDPRMQEMLDIRPMWYDRLRGPALGLAIVFVVVALGVMAKTGMVSVPAKILGAVGIAIGLFWAVTGLTGLWAGPGRRGAQATAQNLLFALILVAGLVLMNYLVNRRDWRLDVTENKYFALSQQTKQVVANLDKDVEVTAFVSPEVRSSRLIRNVMREYRLLAKSEGLFRSRLKVEFLDPKRAGTSGMANALGVQRKDNLIVVKCGDKKEEVQINQPEKLEETLTSAIMAVTTGSKPKVYFLKGHGEFSPEPGGGRGASSWSVVKTLLGEQQYDVTELDFTSQLAKPESPGTGSLLGGGSDEASKSETKKPGETEAKSSEKPETPKSTVRVPGDCACLVIAGAQSALMPEEKKAIEDYLSSNGHAVIALGTGTQADVMRQKKLTAPDFNDILSKYQIRVGDGLIVETVQDIFGRRVVDELLIGDFSPSPVSEDLNRVVMPNCRPVHYEGTPPEQNPMGGPPPPSPGTEILKTGSTAWSETNIVGGGELTKDAGEESGSLPVAVVYGQSEESAQPQMPGMPPTPLESKTPRIVVFGSAAAFIDDYTNSTDLQNFALITKAIAWASGRPDLVTIPPKHMEQRTFSVDRGKRSTIRLVNILVILGIAGTGVYVWWRRR